MRMSRLVYLGLVMILSMLVLPMATAAQGNSDDAHACQHGGYLNYTDADGNPFKNTGQCTRYAAQGEALVPAAYIRFHVISVESPFYVVGTIEGAGLAPGTTVGPQSLGGGSYWDLGPAVTSDGTYSETAPWIGWSCDTDYQLRATRADGSYVYGVFRFPCP